MVKKLVTRENEWKSDRTQTKITTYMRGHCAKKKKNTNRRTNIYPMLMNKIEKRKQKTKKQMPTQNTDNHPKLFFLSCFVLIKFRVSRKWYQNRTPFRHQHKKGVSVIASFHCPTARPAIRRLKDPGPAVSLAILSMQDLREPKRRVDFSAIVGSA